MTNSHAFVIDRLPMNAEADPVTALVGLLNPCAKLSKLMTGKGPWAVRFERRTVPSFYLVLTGRCWLDVDDSIPEPLESGDFLLLNVSPSFTLASRLGTACQPGIVSATAEHHGGLEGCADFEMLSGTFQMSQTNAGLLLNLLPSRIHLKEAWTYTTRLSQLIKLIAEEIESVQPAREMLLSKLVEILLLETLRLRTAGLPFPPTGILAGLHDGKIARALRAMHCELGRAWTVAELARVAGLSRAGFAQRFTNRIGFTPMEYLSRWRMSLAVDALAHRDIPLDQLALACGYESTRAFCTAFRKRVGCRPGTFAEVRRARRKDL